MSTIVPTRMTGSILNRTPAEVAAHLVWLDPDLDVRIEGENIEVAVSDTSKIIGSQSMTGAGRTWGFRSHEAVDWGNGLGSWAPDAKGLNGGMDNLMSFRFVPTYANLREHSHMAMRQWIRAGEPEDMPMAGFIAQGRGAIADENEKRRLAGDLKSVDWARVDLDTLRSVHDILDRSGV